MSSFVFGFRSEKNRNALRKLGPALSFGMNPGTLKPGQSTLQRGTEADTQTASERFADKQGSTHAPFASSGPIRAEIPAWAALRAKSLALAPVIVPCWTQLEFTRRCIAALMRRTRSPWELIVINNGSTDDTSDYPSVV